MTQDEHPLRISHSADDPDRLKRQANTSELRTVVIRQSLIWSKGMPTLERIVAAANNRQLALPDAGRQVVSTSDVDNVVECSLLAAEKGRGGEACYLTDGEDSTLKVVMNDLLGTRGVPPIKRSAPLGFTWLMATVMEGVWRLFRLRTKPPVTRKTLRMIGRTSLSTFQRHAAISAMYRSPIGLKVSRACAEARAAVNRDEWSASRQR